MKTKTTLIVFLLAVIALGAYFYSIELERVNSIPDDIHYVSDEKGNEYLTQEFATEQELNPEIIVDVPGFESAKTASDCEKNPDNYLKGECYKAFALKEKNPAYCENSGEPGQKDSCYYELALATSNPDTCMLMTFEIVDCLREIAVETENPSVCEKASFEKDACFTAVRDNSFEECDKLGINRSTCNDAVYYKDSSLCETIADASQNCFYELAIKTLDAQYCEKVGLLRNACVFSVALDSQNPTYCNLLKDSRDNCVARIAYDTDNIALCEQAGAEKQSCIEDITG